MRNWCKRNTKSALICFILFILIGIFYLGYRSSQSFTPKLELSHGNATSNASEIEPKSYAPNLQGVQEEREIGDESNNSESYYPSTSEINALNSLCEPLSEAEEINYLKLHDRSARSLLSLYYLDGERAASYVREAFEKYAENPDVAYAAASFGLRDGNSNDVFTLDQVEEAVETFSRAYPGTHSSSLLQFQLKIARGDTVGAAEQFGSILENAGDGGEFDSEAVKLREEALTASGRDILGAQIRSQFQEKSSQLYTPYSLHGLLDQAKSTSNFPEELTMQIIEGVISRSQYRASNPESGSIYMLIYSKANENSAVQLLYDQLEDMPAELNEQYSEFTTRSEAELGQLQTLLPLESTVNQRLLRATDQIRREYIEKIENDGYMSGLLFLDSVTDPPGRGE